MKKSEEVNESLFICSQSADPFSIRLLHPLSGSARKAFRGAEFQGGIVRTATFLGQGHLCVALADKPILHSIPVRQPQQRGKGGTAAGQFCTKSILASPAHFLAAHPCGDFIFICSGNKMFVWEVHGGQLLCMVEEHVREVSAMRISSCGNFLATASQDGAVKMFLTASLIAFRDVLNPVRPIGSHAAHSLVVNDLCISPGLNPRILSVSSDHSACLFSLATHKVMLRLTTDQPLTACCMDPAETVVLLGSNTGRILKVYIQTDESENNNNFHPMKSPGNDGITGQFEHHESAIKRLCVNLDGTRLASGDQTGSYCIWDIGNGQSLKSGKMPGPINELFFLISSLGTGNDDQQPNTSSSPLVSNLQRNVATTRILKVKKHVEAADDQKIPKGTSFPAYFNTLLRNFNEQALRGSTTTSASEEPKQVASNAGNKRRRLEPDIIEPPNEPQQQRERVIDLTETLELEQKIAGLEREITRLVQVNSELYNFAASLANEEENS